VVSQTTPTATHQYQGHSSSTVTGTVTDSANLSASKTAPVTVADAPPVAALSVTPSSGTAPLTVTADASGSTDPDTTPISSYTFDFGDTTIVTQTTPTAGHQYLGAGNYTVKVTTTDSFGLSSSATATVAVANAPPVAALTVTPSSGTAPLHVTADSSGSIDPDTTPIMTYTFDFGDGSAAVTQASPTAQHTYGSPGTTYTVRVTATDKAGLTGMKTASVTTDALTPALTLTPSSGAAPLAVTADASKSTDADSTPIASYTIDFGDGTVIGPQTAATATHTYPVVGIYVVKLTVTDQGGLRVSVSGS